MAEASIVGLQGFFIACTTFTTVLRFVSRKSSRGGMWWDDYMILLAVVRERSSLVDSF